MKIPQRAKRILDITEAYSFLQRALGAENVYRELIDHYAKPIADEYVLDVGCGPAKLLSMLPDTRYVGVDIDTAYLASARRNFGEQGEFHLLSADAIETLDDGPFDVIFGVGLIHHLSDEVANKFLATASAKLSATGRLVTIDPCYHPSESRAGRMLVSNDRGEHVRDSEKYEELTSAHFASVELDVRRDLIRVPYTHAIQVARNYQ